MKKFTTKKTILLASILLISGIIVTQAFAHMGGGGVMGGGSNMMGYGGHMMGSGGNMMGNGGGGHMWGNISAEDQKKMFDQMNSFFSSTKDIREQSYQKNIELNSEYSKSEKDQAKIESLQNEIFELSRQFQEKRFDHMTKMQRLFSDKKNS